ncbi:MAG: hypothetical protein M1412_01950 [Deltaproteobacteria bacterium]|nr:hypothetical protein [Deltaproteobacteria bacterium]MCL5891919.1 hypothetical protein [Deltaproteobacteria bacterium]
MKNTAKLNDNLYNIDNAVISANDHLGGSPLSIRETLIWLEESKIFFYKIKKQIGSGNEKELSSQLRNKTD